VKASLDDMYLFAEVVSAGGLIRGAKRLALPKSTVSRRLGKLEQAVGAKLIDRNARHFAVTEIGKAFAERAERMVDAYFDAQDFLSHRDVKPRGVLKVAMPADFAVHYIADALATFTQRHPNVTLDIEASPQLVDIVGERFDLAIRMGKLSDSSMVAKHLLAIRRHFYASRALLKRVGTPKTLAELQMLPFVALRTQAPGASTSVIDLGRNVTFAPHCVAYSNSIGLVRQLVASGAGAGALPDAMATKDMVPILESVELTPVDANLLLPQKQWLPAKTRAFVEHLKAHVQ
jgi:DNA-binding transcriptional LysR family regulator